MTGLRFEVQWTEAEEVSTSELAATWATLRILVGDDPLTLIRDSFSNSYRDFLDVSVYPLAEWIAFNWWSMTTPNAGRFRADDFMEPGSGRSSVRNDLDMASDGFPWPSVSIFPEKDYALASQRLRSQPHSRVTFLRSGQYVLDLADTVHALEKFVDSVVRRLEEQGILDTRLQVEWRSIQDSDPEERDFCRAAAALGFDPYDIPEATADQIVAASKGTGDVNLFIEMLPGLPASQLTAGVEWLNACLESLDKPASQAQDVNALRQLTESFSFNGRRVVRVGKDTPWSIGYSGAREVRDSLRLAPTDVFAPSRFVGHKVVSEMAPGVLEGLARLEPGRSLTVATSTRRLARAKFIEARVLWRGLFEVADGTQVVTHTFSIRDRIERAFAAELLAPAEGVAALLGESFTGSDLARVCRHFGVDVLLVEHQIENQLQRPY